MNLNQVTIPVSDMDVSIQFYKDLGLELIVHTHGDYARFLCPQGGSTFSLHRVDRVTASQTVVYFEVDDIQKTFEELKNSGFLIVEEIEEKPWLWTEFKLKDPSGNNIIIFNAGENRINPPWRI